MKIVIFKIHFSFRSGYEELEGSNSAGRSPTYGDPAEKFSPACGDLSYASMHHEEEPIT
jgi:hypothetical protein